MAELIPEMLEWAIRMLVPGGSLVGVTALREGGPPWLVRVRSANGVVEGVLRPGGPPGDEARRRLASIELAALGMCERHGVPAPRVLAADLDGIEAGETAMLFSVLPGRSRIPIEATRERLLALGAAVATLRDVALSPSRELPERDRSLSDYDFATDRPETPSAALLRDAEAVVAAKPTPAYKAVLVHGDMWQGNTMFVGDEVVGFIDWDCAGAGPHGIDLACIRCDAAIMFGGPAAGVVLEGWEQRARMPAGDVAYWDVVAGLSTPTDMGYWTRPIHDQGRTDLTAGMLNARRDEFLRDALARLTS
jgi:aminoglycoside phosphotransferase (APT) family kinase protein